MGIAKEQRTNLRRRMNAKRLELVNKLQEAAIEAAMRKIWQRERANGETELSYEEWEISGKNEGCENK